MNIDGLADEKPLKRGQVKNRHDPGTMQKILERKEIFSKVENDQAG